MDNNGFHQGISLFVSETELNGFFYFSFI